MARTATAPHSHITQSARPVTGCPACALIRPAAMRAHPYALDSVNRAEPIRHPEGPA